MRKMWRYGLPLLATTALWTATAYSEGGPRPPEQPKAKTIKELVDRYDSSSCIECHEETHKQWANSLHSHSVLGSPRTAPTFVTAMEVGLKNFPYSGVKEDKDITVEHLKMCTKCHLPQLEEATDDVAREIIATIKGWQKAMKEENEEQTEKLEATIASLNINCRVCHNRMALIHKWADGYPQPDTVYGSKAGAHDDPKFPKMAVAPAPGSFLHSIPCSADTTPDEQSGRHRCFPFRDFHASIGSGVVFLSRGPAGWVEPFLLDYIVSFRDVMGDADFSHT